MRYVARRGPIHEVKWEDFLLHDEHPFDEVEFECASHITVRIEKCLTDPNASAGNSYTTAR